MKSIENLEELNNLQLGEKFSVIKNGNRKGYYYAGQNIKTKTAMGISDANVLTVETFIETHYHLNERCAILVGPYNSETVGNMKIAQLKREIEGVESIYLKK
jgi:hypothetical protein